MEFLKQLFDGKALTFDELTAKTTEAGLKVADLSKGDYVAKGKYDGVVADRDTHKANAEKWEGQYKEQVKLGTGDEGLKGQITTLTTDLKAAQDALGVATGKITQRERFDAALDKVKGDKKLAKLLVMEAGEKVSDTVDFATAMEAIIKADDTYKVQETPGDDGKNKNVYVKTPGMADDKSRQETGTGDNTLREAMGLPSETK